MNKLYVNNYKVLITVVSIITIISVVVCCLLYDYLILLSDRLNELLLTNNVKWLSKIGYSFHPLTFTFVFSILFYLFDHIFWRLLSFVGVLTNINGTWCGHFESSYKGEKVSHCVMIIKQSFIRIKITCYFSNKNESKKLSSYSTSFNFYINDTEDDKKYISFSYTNVKRNNKSPDFEHAGFNYFYLNNNELNGQYSSFRNEKTNGNISFKKINNKRKYNPEIWNSDCFD